MAELFGCTPMNVSSHLKAIFKEKELDENSVIKKFFTTAADGKKYLTMFYNLKLIVGQYLSFAEAQAINHIPMRMADWEQNLNIILTMNRKDILETKGRVLMEMTKKKARLEYNAYKEHEHLEDIRELDRDIRAAGTIPPNL